MKSKFVIGIFIVFVTVFTLHYANGQYTRGTGKSYINVPPRPTVNYWGDADRFLDKQSQEILDLASDALMQFKPQLPEPVERRMALLMIDGVMHNKNAPKFESVQVFYHDQITKAITEIETTDVKKGAVIWKMYDHGFIIKTASVTLGFDLIRGYSAKADDFPLSNKTMRRIVSQCDVMFISHRHGDHADDWVVGEFINQSKPVVAPDELWKDRPIHKSISHIAPEAHTLQKLAIRNGELNLSLVVYPGHQGGEMANNVTLVYTPEGLSFAHTGDQSNDDDFEWIDDVYTHHNVDVLLPNCWSTDIVRLADGFNPGVIITGHENELGHTIDHREPYWLTYSRLKESPYPLVLMTWGESYRYPVRGGGH